MERPLVILHGWSDTSKSFEPLADTIPNTRVDRIFLGDYMSLDDAVTLPDLASALQAAWKILALPTDPRSVDVIVHSTGGLVIREWMTRYYEPDSNPIFHLLMLAPANFGSPLAHLGRSMIGRVIKGFSWDKPLQTGTQILKALELASPYSWELAKKDRFPASKSWYGPGKMLCTVLVGCSGYSGIRAAANKPGSDGTVYVATANLNCELVTLDFSTDPQKPTISWQSSLADDVAFSRISDSHHGNIIRAIAEDSRSSTITRALTVADGDFSGHVANLSAESRRIRENDAGDHYKHGYQNTVVRVRDNHGAHVKDFFLELFCKVQDGSNAVDDELTEQIQSVVVQTVHAFGDDSSYRSLMLNVTLLRELVTSKGRTLNISVSAMPDVRFGSAVGYSTIGFEDIGSVKLTPELQEQFFQPDRTVLVDLVLRREQIADVFKLKSRR